MQKERQNRESRARKQKFTEEREAKVFQVEHKNENQKRYMHLLKTKQLVISHGSSGTGKSFLACVHAANEYLRGTYKKIVLIRPYEQVGKSVGLRPGTNEEKLLPLMQSMLQPLETVFGHGQLEYMLEHREVVLEALEDCRGRSYANSIVVVDECQNLDQRAAQALVTRLEESSQLIMCGDYGWQTDIKGLSGLDYILSLVKKLKENKPTYLNQDDINTLNHKVGVVKFEQGDIVRSGLTALFVKAFDNEVKSRG